MSLKMRIALVIAALLAFGSVTAPSQAVTPTFNLTIKVFGLDKKYAPKLKVTGPAGYSKVVTAPAKFQKNIVIKNLKKGTYTVSPYAVKVKKTTKRPAKASYKIALTKSKGLTVSYSKAYLALRTANVREYKMGRQNLSKIKSTTNFVIAPLSAGTINQVSAFAETPSTALPNLDAFLKSGSVSSGFVTFLGGQALGIGNPQELASISLLRSAAYIGQNHLAVLFNANYPAKLFADSDSCSIAVFDLINGLPTCVLYANEKLVPAQTQLITTTSGYLFTEVCPRRFGISPVCDRSSASASVLRFDIATGTRSIFENVTTGLFEMQAYKTYPYLPCLEEILESPENTVGEQLDICADRHPRYNEIEQANFDQTPAASVNAPLVWRPSKDGGLYYLKQGQAGGIYRITPTGSTLKVVDSPEAIQAGFGTVFFEEYADGKLYFGFDTMLGIVRANGGVAANFQMNVFPRPELVQGDRINAFGIWNDSFGLYPTALPEIKIYDPVINQVEAQPWLAFSDSAINNWETYCQPLYSEYRTLQNKYLNCPTPFSSNSRIGRGQSMSLPTPTDGVLDFENSNQTFMSSSNASTVSRKEVTQYSTSELYVYKKFSSNFQMSCGVLILYPVVQQFDLPTCPKSAVIKKNDMVYYMDNLGDFYSHHLESQNSAIIGSFNAEIYYDNVYFDVFQNSFVWATERVASQDIRLISTWKFNPDSREVSTTENPNAEYSVIGFDGVFRDFIYPALG